MSLPVISPSDLSDPRKCLVIHNNRVYDMMSFLPDHPGGSELIASYRGKDVTTIMSDQDSHDHSESAYEMMQEFFVGVPHPKSESDDDSLADSDSTLIDGVYPTGLSCEEDLNVPTNISTDYAKYKFLDLARPLLPQVFSGGFSKEFYLQQVHRPRHYPNGSAPLMPFAWMEPLSKTPWWVVPILWIPGVAYGTYLASQGLSTPILIGCWTFGLFLWTLVEYGMHRVLFHIDEWLPDNRWFLTAHFLLHGVHHYLPTDRLRLVMPPTLFIALAYPWYKLAHTIFPYYIALAIYSGGIAGYISYDMTHYFLHHRNLPSYWRELKRYHLAHHYKNFELGYGVTSKFWDVIFGTELDIGPKVRSIK